MKKKLFLLLVLLLPLMVYADTYPKVLSLDATLDKNTINFNGTTEPGSHAAMCKLIDSTNKEIDMLSVAVDNNEFEGTFIAPTTGNYTISCANYEGGEIKPKTVTVTSVATYTVTFNSNGGSDVPAATVTSGDVVAEPETPTWDGYTFDGWYEDNTLTTPFNFGTRITKDTTLYAGWIENGAPQIETTVVHTIFFGEGGTYQVDFETTDPDHQGPLNAPITNSAMYNVPVDGRMTLTAIPNENNHFKGWYSVREVDTDGEGHMEWEEVELLSSELVYNFMPTGSPYIKPVFEENVEEREPIVVEFVTNCEDSLEDITLENPGPIEEPRQPVNDGYNFEGWYEDATFTTLFDFDRDVTENLKLYAKWTEAGETYTVTDDDGNIVIFKDEENRDFELVIIDIMKLTEEELAENGITQEMYEEVEAAVTEAVKEYGTMLAFYDINIIKDDGTLRDDKSLDIKIPYDEETMGKYNSFKLVYIDINNNITVEEVVDLDLIDGYLVGHLQHLSNYILTGTTVDTTNPKTADTLYLWIATLIASFSGVVIGTIALIKRKKLS